MRHLDLFSGIGGFALAARWVGWETIGFCEIDPYCQKVLAKHWPGVPIYDDIRQVTAERLRADGIIRAEARSVAELNAMADTASADARCREGFTEGQKPVNGQSTQFLSDAGCGSGATKAGRDNRLVITGGFPCQDISYAGKGAGIDGERSGLWTELARIIGEVRPRYAVLENVAALLSRGLDRVAGDLAEIGYDCEWHCIPASAIGAPHRRDRIWIVAYPNGNDTGPFQRKENSKPQKEVEIERGNNTTGLCADVADTHLPRLEGWLRRGLQECASERAAGAEDSPGSGSQWITEPNVGRVANGVPARVDRLRGLGNAIVPQVAQVIFEAIQEVDNIDQISS